MEKKQVLLVQVSHTYGDNIFLPYPAGRLWASCLGDANLRKYFELAKFTTGRPAGFVFLREDPVQLVEELAEAPAIALFSCYLWNEQWNRQFARALRKRFPSTKLVAGGPQIPARREDITDELEYYDLLVRGEGEYVVKLILNAVLNNQHLGSEWVCTPQVSDLSVLPSPYLSGVFDEILAHPAYKGFDWTIFLETHRGCPYRCAFCAWHGTLSKIADFPLEVIFGELQWVSTHRVKYIFNCDANFGIRPGVAEAVVDKLVELKAATGYPERFSTAWAKANADKLLSMNKKLAQAGLSKGVTLSLQSADADVLKNINRQDKAVDQYKSDIAAYDAAHIYTYTELIIGLPGETLESFTDTLDFILDCGRHDGLMIYPCVVLPGAKLSEPAYQKEHGIETVTTLPILNHGKPDSVQERCTIVRATNTMPAENTVKAFLLGWAVLTFHTLGFFRDLGIRLHLEGLRYTDMYRTLAYGGSFDIFTKIAQDFYAGKGSEGVLRYGVQWHLEEAAFLELITQTTEPIYHDLCNTWLRQLAMTGLVTSDELHTYWKRLVKPAEFATPEEYATKIVWYGRKGGSTLRPLRTGTRNAQWNSRHL